MEKILKEQNINIKELTTVYTSYVDSMSTKRIKTEIDEIEHHLDYKYEMLPSDIVTGRLDEFEARDNFHILLKKYNICWDILIERDLRHAK